MKNDQPEAVDEPIGRILKKRRQALRLSLTDVELATKIRGKFLIALESGDYTGLSHDIYAKGFVQSYSEFLGLNGRVIAKHYLAERGDLPEERPKPSQAPSRGFVITPRLVIAAVAVLLLVAVSSYLAWQVSTLAAPPALSVTSPSADEVLEGSLADINGRVTLGADVFINDAPVLTDINGNFSEKVALQNGVNVIRIVAKNRLGKTSTVTRNILAKTPKPLVADAAPATIDGVRVDVTTKKAAVAISVNVDGKDVFSGTMLSGTTQTFSGNNSVIITSGNAGETALKVTNATVVAKNLDPIGAEGEIKRNLEFDKDTVIP